MSNWPTTQTFTVYILGQTLLVVSYVSREEAAAAVCLPVSVTYAVGSFLLKYSTIASGK